MAFDFILMLTSNDRTIPDARVRVDEALEGGVRHIGFKDVGLPFDELKAVADAIRASGGRSYLEVVSLDEQSELASARAAVNLDVDCLLGGTRAAKVTEITRRHPIRYYPFPGQIVDHPSVLEGPSEAIVASAKQLADLEYVHGLDLLAYRFKGDVPELMRQVCTAVEKPVIMAGSIDSKQRVDACASAGAAGFTVGTAAFDEVFPAKGSGFAEQIRTILDLTSTAKRNSTAPLRLALAAHDTRKSHLRAWVHRFSHQLGDHRLICTGDTGRMLKDAIPSLNIHRLQRGSRGGDQQLGALVATGELDAVIFFADPTQAHSGDVDMQALTRLAMLHDTPVALSPASADMIANSLFAKL
ncbi:MAG: methylglyoxal synthase [Paracoccaceae bacterium]|jgi:methylglyoxal synthase|nr:methylglyoxal synthase [Paracoccaceae bacterium]